MPLFRFGVAVKPGLCWWAFAASRVPQFSAPVFLACFSVSWSRPVGRALHGVVA